MRWIICYGYLLNHISQAILMSIHAIYEPHHEITCSLHMRKQRHRYAVQLISAFVFATQIVQSLYFLNPKFQGTIHLLWLFSRVCVGPGQKPPETGFLATRLISFMNARQRLSFMIWQMLQNHVLCSSKSKELKQAPIMMLIATIK